MSLKGACDKLESAFADAESKLDRVNEKVDLQIAKANQPGEHIVSYSDSHNFYISTIYFQVENLHNFFKISKTSKRNIPTLLKN